MNSSENRKEADVTLLGRLADNDAEQAYQCAQSLNTRRRMRFVCIMTAIAYLGAIYADSTQLGPDGLARMITVRCLAALCCLPAIILSFRESISLSRFGAYTGFYMTAIMAGEIAELVIKAGQVSLPETPITVFMVLLYYLFLPPQIWQSLVAGAGGTIAYLAILALVVEVPAAYMANTALLFAVANGFGLYFFIRFGAAHRREYLVRAELRHMAEIDGLTGIPNRRRVLDLGTRELNAARRYGHACSLLILDIDHFKNVNDTYGHAAGDAVLRNVAEVCAGCLREVDLFGRLGGEEFVIFLPSTDLVQGGVVAERLRDTVERTPFIISGMPVHVTISIGIAELAKSGPTLDELMRAADSAMYKAKRTGRNKVMAADNSSALDLRENT